MNKPRVLLINLPYVIKHVDASRPKLRSFLAFPYGLLSIATYCKDLAEFKIIDCDADPDYLENVYWEVNHWMPDIVGFSMMFDNSYVYLEEFLSAIRAKAPTIMTLLGGAAASYSWKEILSEQPLLDAICYSEGETPFRQLLEADNRDTFLLCNPSWITHWPAVVEALGGPQISSVKNLDDVIDLDYSLIDHTAYNMQQAFSPFVDYSKPHKQFFIMTSRGCPFGCRFCSNAAIHGKQMRFASVPAIISHVRKLVDNYGMDVLTIYDDQLLIDKPRAKELFSQLAQFKLRIECPNGLSPAFIDSEMAHLMRQAGLDTAYLAIEHGSSYVLEEIIQKPLKLWMVKPVVKMLQNEGIFCHGFFVIGMPGETQEHRRETVDFILDIGLDWAGFNPATPVRGSQLYNQCLENGWIKPQGISDIVDKKYIINAPEIGLTPEIIDHAINEMNFIVNFFNNRRMKMGDYETAAKCFEEVIRRYKGHVVAKKYLEICKGRIKAQ